MAKDMTRGNPSKLIFYFSVPLLIGNIFQQFYSMVDTIIVGRYIGVNALAAVGSTGSITFLIIGFVLGITSGLSVLISQKFGAKDNTGLRKAVASSIIISSIVTIIITTLSIVFLKPILNIMNTPHDIIDDAYSYLLIIFAGICATMFYNMISSILRALGDSKTPLYFLIVSSILNIILDIVFIVNFSMGVEGAAYATVISQGISALLCLFYTYKRYSILKLHKKDFALDYPLIKKQLNISIPMALQFSITALGAMILQSALNKFGSTFVAAYTAASKVEQIAMQPCISFGITMATYSAQNLGAGRIDRIKEGVKKCTMISLSISIAATVILTLWGGEFTKIFLDNADPNVVSYAKQYLSISGFFFAPLSLIFVYRNTLQGIGDTFVPMMAGGAELLARTIVAFTLPNFIGYIGICLANPAAWLAAAIPLVITYFKRIKTLT